MLLLGKRRQLGKLDCPEIIPFFGIGMFAAKCFFKRFNRWNRYFLGHNYWRSMWGIFSHLFTSWVAGLLDDTVQHPHRFLMCRDTFNQKIFAFVIMGVLRDIFGHLAGFDNSFIQ